MYHHYPKKPNVTMRMRSRLIKAVMLPGFHCPESDSGSPEMLRCCGIESLHPILNALLKAHPRTNETLLLAPL